MVREWLCENMFGGDATHAAKAETIVNFLGDHSITGAHARHIPLSKCEEIGLKVEKLEDDKKLQDLVLTVHHAYMHTFSMSPAIKIVENQIGVATVYMGATQQVLRALPAQGLPQELLLSNPPRLAAPEPTAPSDTKPNAP